MSREVQQWCQLLDYISSSLQIISWCEMILESSILFWLWSVHRSWVLSSTSQPEVSLMECCIIFCTVTNPIDVVKIRLQLSNELNSSVVQSRISGHFFGCFGKIATEEGYTAFWKGSALLWLCNLWPHLSQQVKLFSIHTRASRYY